MAYNTMLCKSKADMFLKILVCNDNASCNINAITQANRGSAKVGFVRQDHGQIRDDACMTFILNRHTIQIDTVISLFPDYLGNPFISLLQICTTIYTNSSNWNDIIDYTSTGSLNIFTTTRKRTCTEEIGSVIYINYILLL